MSKSTFRQALKRFVPESALLALRRLRRRLNRLPSHAIYQQALAGKSGLEVGGPSQLFRDYLPVYPVVAALDGVNFSNSTLWEGEIAAGGRFEFDRGRGGRQFIAEATALDGIETGRYEFLLSSNCLEHVANPLKALREWMRVVEPGGVLLLVLPNQQANFDHRRPVTRLEHLLDDERQGVGEDDLTHLDEVLALHDLDRDPGAVGRESFTRRSLDNLVHRGLHHHIFDPLLIAQMTAHVGLLPIRQDSSAADFFYLGRTPR
jgi:SAM-dependent methyltransferase